MTRPKEGDVRIESGDVIDDDNGIALLGHEDLLDVGSKRGFLLPGDMVELMYVS